ncbi:hypothetical protein ZWY2020_014973 [Hordeum vulgare]|nr:hypothetical protein ZWY2020_014973 [Hordeum vulgare]
MMAQAWAAAALRRLRPPHGTKPPAGLSHQQLQEHAVGSTPRAAVCCGYDYDESPAPRPSSDVSVATVSSETAPTSQSQLLHFIKSTFGTLKGKNHCWLNAVEGIWKTFNQEGIYLVLLYQSHETLDGDSKHSDAFRKLKYLHQSQAVRTIMEEYITFPILLSDKEFTNMTNGACYLLFEGSKDDILFAKLDGDPEPMIRGMEGFSALTAEPSENVLESGVPWQKEEVVKEPYVGSLRNLLLYHPGGLSVDEDGDRIFISDSNHHRIIISNGDGVILDCIGSSPGFEDGEFESAKLMHPAASFYHAAEDCLYIVDSENHAVRKADFGRRFLETVYPVFNKKEVVRSKKDEALNIQDFDVDSVVFPWHLLQISEDDLLVAARNFETSWILSMSTGEKQNILRGRAEAMELCQQMIDERHALLKDIHINGSSGDKDHSNLLEKIPCNGLRSQFQDSEMHSLLGHSAGQFQEHSRKKMQHQDLCRHPVDTELATPLVESCIWRQVRGSGAEISESDAQETTSEKVGIAQQWYDEIDNLAFSEAAEEPAVHKGDDKPADESHQDQKCGISPAQLTSALGHARIKDHVTLLLLLQLVASAALYLKVDRMKADHKDQKTVIKRILQCQGHEEHAGVELLTENHRDARDLVIMKPVHIRLRMEALITLLEPPTRRPSALSLVLRSAYL